MLDSIINGRIADLKSLFLATKEISHSGEKGALREAFVMNLLSSFLPEHYGLGSGIVIDRFGRQSVQVDIIIYDKRIAPPIIQAAGRGAYLVDSVVRAIEVKSVLDHKAIKQFSKMITCFEPNSLDCLRAASRGRLENGYLYYPICAMFAFASDIKDIGAVCSKDEVISNSQSLVYANTGHLWREAVKGRDKEPYLGRYISFENDTFGLRLFIGLLLNNLEKTSSSRSLYSPLDWIIQLDTP